MAVRLNFKSWDNTPSYSKNFQIVSKYTDLGVPDSKKSILGVILNVAVSTESTASRHSSYIFSVNYRKGMDDNYRHLATFNNIYKSSFANKGNIEIIKLLSVPIKNIINIQLQIRGHGIRNDIGINDFGLIFRTYRDSSVVRFDEE